MTRVLFIYIDSMTSSGFSTGLGIASLSGYLKKNGIHTDLVYFKGDDRDYLIQKVCSVKPDIIGFYSTASGYPVVKEMSSCLRSYSDALQIYGGIHVMSFPDVLFECDIDAICMGCGEIPLLELCRNPKLDADIPGIYFRKNAKPANGFKAYFPGKEFFDELLDFDYGMFLKELDRFPDFRKEDYRLEIIFNRGCPFSCSFCSNHVLNRIYGHRTVTPSPDASIDALKRALTATGMRQVEIHDDTFTLNKKWFRPFIRRYIDEVRLPFQCNLRAGCFDEEDVRLLKDANAQTVWLGLESGNEYIRNNIMKKGVSDAQLVNALQLLGKYGIHVITQNIIGVPEENPERFLDTVRFNAKFNPGDAVLSIFYPYPGTELYEICSERGYLKDRKMLKVERTESILEMPDFPRERIEHFFSRFQDLIRYEKQRQISSCMPELDDSNVDDMLKKNKTESVWPVELGALKANQPVSRMYGLDRGHAIDRYYIEKFIAAHAGDVKGKCLEILNSHYTLKCNPAVKSADILDIDAENKVATVVADLRNADCIDSGTYDCFICTQTFHLIDEMDRAINESFRILRNGGVLLATMPCMSRCDIAAGNDSDFWRITPAGAKYLFEKAFGPENVEVFAYGNVKSGMAFWEGMAQEDIGTEDLDFTDGDFPVLVGIRAVKGRGNTEKQASVQPPARRSEANCAVLLYHRVCELEEDPSLLGVSPQNFRRHMAFLSRKYELLSPDDFLKCVERKSWPSVESALITFDDGYYDNLANAVPILGHYGAGSVFFVAGGYAGGEREFWWDEVEKHIFSKCVPEKLSLPGGFGFPDTEFILDSKESRLKAYSAITYRLQRQTPALIEKSLEFLRCWSGIEAGVRGTHRTMNMDELRALASTRNMEIGGHTDQHVRLSSLKFFEQYESIAKDKSLLESITGRQMRFFSYPFGYPGEGGDQNEDSYDVAALCGYKAAFINDSRIMRGRLNDAFTISRIIARDGSIVQLRSSLETAPAVPASAKSAPNEALIMESVVNRRLDDLLAKNMRRLALYGAGRHTAWLMSLLKKRNNDFELAAILDDNPVSDRFLGVKCCRLETMSGSSFCDVIIASSDMYGAKLKARAAQILPDVACVDLYEGLPPGPYAKRQIRSILQNI